jgi:hypothetical protein
MFLDVVYETMNSAGQPVRYGLCELEQCYVLIRPIVVSVRLLRQ